jgi:Mg2+/Co2+ transporter CorB
MLLVIFVLILLIFVSAFFSSAETGLMSIDRYKLEYKAQSGNHNARRILKLLSRPDRLLGVILIGNTFANILASALATMLAIKLFGEQGIIVATILLTLVILIFAEVAPKTVAATHPSKIAFIAAYPLQLLLWLLYPLVWLINMASNTLLTLVNINVKNTERKPLSHAELRNIVHSSAESLARKDKDMLLGIFDLKQINVDEIMLPRNEIVGIDLNDPIEQIIQQLQHVSHTRIPLYYGNIDKVVGLLHVRTIIYLLKQPKITHRNLRAKAHQPYFIPATTSLTEQLLHFQRQKQRIAFIVDEYGNIQGLITIDDILEEVVGEFTTTVTDISQEIRKQDDNSYLIDGSITVRELNRKLGINLRSDGPNTLNGIIIEQLESIPTIGTSLRLPNMLVEIIEVDNHCVKLARVKLFNT